MAGKSSTTAAARRGDFTATPRMLLVTALAVPVGAVSACVAWAFLRLIGLIVNGIFYDRLSTRLLLPAGGHASPWIVLLAPAAGGLVVGLLARYGSDQVRGQGIPEAIESVLLDGSKVGPRVAVLKPIASAVAIGTGGPFGAEGPIIMTGGAFGSLFAQFLRLTADERKVLLVAGAVSGMAATFNTPFSAIMLAVEFLLFEWRPRSYVPVVAAVCTATLVRYPLLGDRVLFSVPLGRLHLTLADYGLSAVLGLAGGMLAVAATLLVHAAKAGYRLISLRGRHLDRMWWPALGGLLVGVGGLFVPQVLGVGYKVIDDELNGSIGLSLVVGILVVKTAVWAVALGSGTSGGIFAPMFMVGGALGALASIIFPAVAPGFWELVALAAVLGGVMRLPFTGVIFALELTHRFNALVPVIIGASAAYALSVLVLKRSVLTEKIPQNGHHLTREYAVDPLEVLFAGDVVRPDPVTFPPQTPARLALDSLSGTDPETSAARRQMLYPVVNADGLFLGLVTRTGLETAVHSCHGEVAVQDLVVAHPVVASADETLHEVAVQMADAGVDRVPVVDSHDTGRLLGIVSLSTLLAGRVKSVHEAQDRERVLRFHLSFGGHPARRHRDAPST